MHVAVTMQTYHFTRVRNGCSHLQLFRISQGVESLHGPHPLHHARTCVSLSLAYVCCGDHAKFPDHQTVRNRCSYLHLLRMP